MTTIYLCQGRYYDSNGHLVEVKSAKPSELVEWSTAWLMGRIGEALPGDDTRSPMIRMLDGYSWRESLLIADVFADQTLWHDDRRPNLARAGVDYDPGPAVHQGYGIYTSDVIWRKSDMIRMLDAKEWRESVEVARMAWNDGGHDPRYTWVDQPRQQQNNIDYIG